ncbi:MAG: glycosyltransferase [Planctomycetes bacterium]|nr:glycosyltransferase [Planctomycetota bacterium]
MRFSVLTPSFNQGSFLERNIRSVLEQDVPGTEHIICDGGSKDSTVDVLKKYSDRLAYWVSEKDAGQADALNKALGKATGDIIGWINVDEYYEPNIFGLVARAFEENAMAVLVYGDYNRVDPNGKLIRVNRQYSFDYDICRVAAPIVMNCAAFFRRDRLIEVGGFDASYQFMMDWEMYVRLMRGNQGWVRLKKVLANFTMHTASKTSTLQETLYREVRRMKTREFPGVPEVEMVRKVKRAQRHMKWLMLKDGVFFEKVWFNVFRRRHFNAYFGDAATYRIPLLTPLLDIIDPVKKIDDHH